MPIQRTYEANVLYILFSFCVFVSQFCKCVDDDTEDNVHENDVYDDEATHVVEETDEVLNSVVAAVGLAHEHVSDTTGRSRSLKLTERVTKEKIVVKQWRIELHWFSPASPKLEFQKESIKK